MSGVRRDRAARRAGNGSGQVWEGSRLKVRLTSRSSLSRSLSLSLRKMSPKRVESSEDSSRTLERSEAPAR
eukprot:4359679-Prymnesium_polylepis.3